MPPGEQGPGAICDLVGWPMEAADVIRVAVSNSENRNLLIVYFLLVSCGMLEDRVNAVREIMTIQFGRSLNGARLHRRDARVNTESSVEDRRSEIALNDSRSIFYPRYSMLEIAVQIKALDSVDDAPAVEAFDHAGSREAAYLFAQTSIGQEPRQSGDQ